MNEKRNRQVDELFASRFFSTICSCSTLSLGLQLSLYTDCSLALPKALSDHEVRQCRMFVFHKIIVKLTLVLPP